MWNADNLISQVDDQVGTTHFAYDGLGERVKKTNGSTTSLYPFGDDYEVTNGVTTKYISVEGLGVVAKKVTGGSNPGTFWIHTDRLGSIDAVTKVRRQHRIPADLPPLRRDALPGRQPHRVARLDRPEERHGDRADVPPCQILRSQARDLPEPGSDRGRRRDEPVRLRLRGSGERCGPKRPRSEWWTGHPVVVACSGTLVDLRRRGRSPALQPVHVSLGLGRGPSPATGWGRHAR